MDTYLTLQQREGGELVILEDIEIKCSRLILSAVKRECEGNWKNIHKKFIDIVAKKQEEKEAESKGEKAIDGATLGNTGNPIAA